MSAATVSSTDLATVFVRLLGEGTDVWRPVEAVRLGETTYRLEDSAAPEDETWIFQPGDIVVVERRRSDDGHLHACDLDGLRAFVARADRAGHKHKSSQQPLRELRHRRLPYCALRSESA